MRIWRGYQGCGCVCSQSCCLHWLSRTSCRWSWMVTSEASPWGEATASLAASAHSACQWCILGPAALFHQTLTSRTSCLPRRLPWLIQDRAPAPRRPPCLHVRVSVVSQHTARRLMEATAAPVGDPGKLIETGICVLSSASPLMSRAPLPPCETVPAGTPGPSLLPQHCSCSVCLLHRTQPS